MQVIRIIYLSILWLSAYIILLPVRIFRGRNDGFMLISEEGLWARDNGYHFFCYVKETHPEIRAYYVIKSTSTDRVRLEKYSDSLVDFRSFRHCLLFWRAKYLISTHIRGGYSPVPSKIITRLNTWLHLYSDKRVIDLKHGIIKDYLPLMEYQTTHLNLLVCGAEPEWKYMLEAHHYPSSIAKYTGLCRWDKLHDINTKPQIVLMPTWRKYLNGNTIKDSEYVRTYVDLLQDKALAQLLDESNVDLIFYPHNCMQPFLHLFETDNTSTHIKIASNKEYDVQTLLKESALLITDFSSVFFDFAYMEKPMIFFQFDEKSYRKGHYSQGYFNYEDSFGPVVMGIPSLIESITSYLENGMVMEPKYKEKVKEYFPILDKNNCERVFDAVLNC